VRTRSLRLSSRGEKNATRLVIRMRFVRAPVAAANKLQEGRTLKKSTRSGRQKRIGAAAEPTDPASELATAKKTASSVGHELNNLLTVIQINTEFLLESAGSNGQSVPELEDIQLALRRATILARQLLAASRAEPFDSKAAEAALNKRMADIAAKAAAVEEARSRTAETILLVEDEASVRTLAKRILTHRGYRVLDAADGAIALRLAAGHVGEIDLVVSDLAMPNLGGRGMVEELQELSPGMRVLFMSGFPREEVLNGADVKHTPYLQKPFTGESLWTEVRAALGYTE
jgi:CheY-like chemotaxis protein